jgi:hypothetical protein
VELLGLLPEPPLTPGTRIVSYTAQGSVFLPASLEGGSGDSDGSEAGSTLG